MNWPRNNTAHIGIILYNKIVYNIGYDNIMFYALYIIDLLIGDAWKTIPRYIVYIKYVK